MKDIRARNPGVSYDDSSVLRENKVIAILLGLGYAHINSSAFQKKVVSGIVDRIKAFVDRWNIELIFLELWISFSTRNRFTNRP